MGLAEDIVVRFPVSHRSHLLVFIREIVRDRDLAEDVYVIRCQGLHVQIWVNGHKTVDYTEPDKSIPQTGVIGLQIHGGHPGDLRYKGITLTPLSAEK